MGNDSVNKYCCLLPYKVYSNKKECAFVPKVANSFRLEMNPIPNSCKGVKTVVSL